MGIRSTEPEPHALSDRRMDIKRKPAPLEEHGVDMQGGAGVRDNVPRDRGTGEQLSGAQGLRFPAPVPTAPSWTCFHEISASSQTNKFWPKAAGG